MCIQKFCLYIDKYNLILNICHASVFEFFEIFSTHFAKICLAPNKNKRTYVSLGLNQLTIIAQQVVGHG